MGRLSVSRRGSPIHGERPSISARTLSFAASRAILNCISAATAELPSPTPTMAVFGPQVDELTLAQQAMTSRAVGTKAARDEKAEVVRLSLESLRHYVQTLCDASPSHAASLIAAAGMKASRRAPSIKPVLSAKPGKLPGTIALAANRSLLVGATHAACVFAWEYSLDGGKTWVAVTSTSVARTVVTGLPSATSVTFRTSVSTAKVAGAWSQVVTTVVH